MNKDPEPEDFDIDGDMLDFSKWKVRKQRDTKGKNFYQVIRKDARSFKVLLPNGDEIKTKAIWIE